MGIGLGRKIAAGVAMSTVLIGGSAGMASASANDCAVGNFCGWVDNQFSGARQNTVNFRNTLGAFHDTYNSAWNRTGSTKRLYYSENCSGGIIMDLGPNQSNGNFGWFQYDDTDSIGRLGCA